MENLTADGGSFGANEVKDILHDVRIALHTVLVLPPSITTRKTRRRNPFA